MKEDKIPLIVDVESSKAQQAIRELEKDSKNLREENKARMNQMLALEKAGKAETEAYKISLRNTTRPERKSVRIQRQLLTIPRRSASKRSRGQVIDLLF